MAIVEYTCNTCKRNILIPENRKGLDVFLHCIITSDCRGVLSQVKLLPAYLRGDTVGADIAAANWTPRKILYTHKQTLLSSKWFVPHNLNNYPDVNVYVDNGVTQSLEKNSGYTVNYTSANNLELVFKSRTTGVVQCIAKYNNTVVPAVVNTLSNLVAVTWNNIVTVAVPHGVVNPVLHMVLIPPNKPSTYGIQQTVSLTTNDSHLAWYGSNNIFVNGRSYDVYTFEVPTINGNIHSFDQYSFHFTAISSNPVAQSDLLILLATGTATVDKTLHTIIDSYQFSLNDNNIIDNSVVYVSSSLIKPVFPAITIL